MVFVGAGILLRCPAHVLGTSAFVPRRPLPLAQLPFPAPGGGRIAPPRRPANIHQSATDGASRAPPPTSCVDRWYAKQSLMWARGDLFARIEVAGSRRSTLACCFAAVTRWRFVCILPVGQNRRSHQCLHWWQQHATGMLHLRSVRIHIKAEKRHTKRCVSFLVGDGGFEPPKA